MSVEEYIFLAFVVSVALPWVFPKWFAREDDSE